MKIIRVAGGVGNQLFQYAFYREQIKHGNDALLDLSWFYDKNRKYYYPFQIGELGFEYLETKNKKLIFLPPKIYAQLPMSIRNNKYVYRYSLYSSGHTRKGSYYFEESLFDDSNDYLHGYWINYRYSIISSHDMLSEISFPMGTSESIEVEKMIKRTESVSIHIRLNDYNFESFNSVNAAYYNRAIDYIKTIVQHPVFYIFSNKISEARKILTREDVDFFFVDINDRNNGLGDMKLMSLCKHNIISASTFSYWGAFFNTNKDKKVIVPSRWEESVSAKTFVNPDWIIL